MRKALDKISIKLSDNTQYLVFNDTDKDILVGSMINRTQKEKTNKYINDALTKDMNRVTSGKYHSLDGNLFQPQY